MNEETKGPETPKSEKPPISKEELVQILEAHRKWVESEEKEGERADLSNADLQGTNLQKAYFDTVYRQQANLPQEADLQDTLRAYHVGTNLQRADLSGANLQGAFLAEAKLQDARLDEANLQGGRTSPSPTYPEPT